MTEPIFVLSSRLDSDTISRKTEHVDESRGKLLKTMLARKIQEWSQQSTSHGIPKLAANSKNIIMRLMWTGFLLISIGVCAFMIVKSTSEYLEYDVTTKIREIYVDEIRFPVVSICNLNPFVTSTANEFWYEFLREPQAFNISKYFVNASLDELDAVTPNDDKLTVEWLQYIIAHPKFNDSLRREFSYWPWTFFDCHFRYLPCDPLVQLDRFYHMDYGNCYRFNAKTSNQSEATVGREGDGFGLSMFIGPSDLLFGYSFQTQHIGVQIFINDADTIPYTQPGLLILPGTSAFIQVSRIETTTLPKPYSSCIEADQVRSELALEMRRIGRAYTRRECLMMCEQKIIIENNGCYSLVYPKIYENFPPCPNLVTFEFNLTDCLDQCPHECNSIAYETSISSSTYPSRNFMEQIVSQDTTGLFRWAFQIDSRPNNNNSDYSKPFDSLELARGSLVKIFVYFDQIKYTRITEASAVTFVDLIANIGGELGLFIGISFLSFVELIELSLELIRIVWISYTTNMSRV